MAEEKGKTVGGSLLDHVVKQAEAKPGLEAAMKRAQEIMSLHRQIEALQVGILNRESDLIMAGRRIAELTSDLESTQKSLQAAMNGLKEWEAAALEASGGDMADMDTMISEVAAQQEAPDRDR
jgi:hypothetical protein